MVQQAGNITTSNLNFSFVRDRSEVGEFFLDIKSASSTAKTDGTKTTTEARRTKKRIRIVDIEAIEPTQGIKFKLTYHARPTIYDQFSFKQDKTLKTEFYSSRHIAQIMDGLTQVTRMYEENELQLDLFLTRDKEGTKSQNSADFVVTDAVSNRLIATSDTYRQRAITAQQQLQD